VEQSPNFRPGQYLTFRVAQCDFAIDASRVYGIIPSNQTVDFPVIDLRSKLGLPVGRAGRHPCIVVLEGETPLSRAGFLVDGVSNVVTARQRDYSHGKIRMRGRPRQVLDADAILSGADDRLSSSALVARRQAAKGDGLPH
jgi:chemotaxis signal transduction protein